MSSWNRGAPILSAKTTPWTEAEIAVIKHGYGKEEYKEIYKKLPGRSTNSVGHMAGKLGVRPTRLEYSQFISGMDDQDFFAQPNKLNSYISGLIASDGNIYNNTIAIQLSDKDVDYLTKVAGLISPSINVRTANGATAISFSSPKAVADLKSNFNITPRKSLTLEAPNLVRKDHIKAYIAGIICGDGSINYQRGGPGCNWRYITLSITGSEPLLTWIEKQLPLRSKIEPGNENCYTLRYRGRRAEEIYYYLYDPSLPLMDRKWKDKPYKIWNPR